MGRWISTGAAGGLLLVGTAALALVSCVPDAPDAPDVGEAPEGRQAGPEAAFTTGEPESVTTEVEFVTTEVTEGLGLPFSEAARVGDLVLLSGMIGNRPGTLELVPGGIEPETRQTLENVRTVLAAVGASPEDVVKCTVMLDDMGEWPRFNEIYVEFFGEHRPARSAFGSDGLALGAAVELECMAVLRRR